jgi:Tol biopolymer transport system component
MTGRAAHRRLALIVAAAAVLAAPVAKGDVIAATDLRGPGGAATDCPQQTDIALINAATGDRSSLPAGINTSLDEVHPAISPAGDRLVFQRVDPVGGTTRTIAADLNTGQQADLFSFFEK